MAKKIILGGGLLAILIIVSSAFFLAQAKHQIAKVKINNTEIKVETAATAKAHYFGLSGRKGLCPDCGMLFIFPEKAERTFVMREMIFPIDIIWISGEKIVKIDEELPLPDSPDLKKYSSGQPVDYVLEVNNGFCRENNIKAGDRVEYLK